MTATKAKPMTRRRILVVFAALFAILAALYFADRLLLNPWSMSVTGKPTLTGYWHGQVAFAPDDRRTLVMHVKHHWTTGHGDSIRIDGSAELCGKPGVQRSELSGKPLNHSGSRFTVAMYEDGNPPGKYLDQLNGEWSEGRITIRTTYTTIGPDGAARGSSTDDNHLTIELRRASETEYEQAC